MNHSSILWDLGCNTFSMKEFIVFSMKEFKEFKLFSEGGNNSEEVVMLLFVCLYIFINFLSCWINLWNWILSINYSVKRKFPPVELILSLLVNQVLNKFPIFVFSGSMLYKIYFNRRFILKIFLIEHLMVFSNNT